MIGTIISKPLDTKEKAEEYSRIATWCNENNAMIADRNDYYEVIEAPKPEPIAWDDSFTQLQMALVEQYETTLALQEELTNTQMALTELYETVIGE